MHIDVLDTSATTLNDDLEGIYHGDKRSKKNYVSGNQVQIANYST
jgi:hypothetical protein